MRALLWCLLLLAAAVPAQAGHGTIEETDEAVIVEFTGDPTDKPNDNRANSNTSATAAAPRQSYESKPQEDNTDQSSKSGRRSRRGRYRGATPGENAE